MPLRLKQDMPTAHITWESRGYEERRRPTEGDPVSAPGLLEGQPYSRCFRRKGRGLFGVRGILDHPDDPDELVAYRVAMGLGAGFSDGGGHWDTSWVDVEFLDGGVYYYGPCEGRPFATLDVTGNKAVRLLCHRLGLRQPKRFPDEEIVPDCADLEWELWCQLSPPPH